MKENGVGNIPTPFSYVFLRWTFLQPVWVSLLFTAKNCLLLLPNNRDADPCVMTPINAVKPIIHSESNAKSTKNCMKDTSCEWYIHLYLILLEDVQIVTWVIKIVVTESCELAPFKFVDFLILYDYCK